MLWDYYHRGEQSHDSVSWFHQFYAALQPHRSAHLGHSSIEIYREAYESISYPDKEW